MMKKINDQVSKYFKSLVNIAKEIDKDRLIPLEQIEISIRSMYDQKHRYYHNIKHINNCLKRVKEYRRETKTESDCDNLLNFAILTHDIIHHPGSTGDEINSAFVAKAFVQQLGTRIFRDMEPQDIVNELESMIYVTSHVVAPHSPHREHCSEAIIADCDLYVLGSPPETFEKYEANIRKEYKYLRDSYYNNRRIKFLEQIINKPNIFWTEYFRDTYEQQARTNIRSTLSKLRE
jgi:predicted metal-dependent HD superfamily phosphohydrolase